MKHKYLYLLVACVIFSILTSCEDDDLKDEQNYFEVLGGYVRNFETKEIVEGLPVGIYEPKYNLAGYFLDSLSYFNLLYRCKTNDQGFFSYTYKYDPDNFPNHYGWVRREIPFDSTKIEWQYVSNRNSAMGEYPGYTDFSSPLKVDHPDAFDFGSYDKAHGFYVVPAGWVAINILDFKTDIIVVECENKQTVWDWDRRNSWNSYNANAEEYYSFGGYEFALEPSKTHRFNFYKRVKGENVLLKSMDIFIPNAFDHNSTPEKFAIKVKRIDVKIYE